MKHQLEADGIELFFGARKILGNIYIKCETGAITGLLARNGEGKTSLMNIIYGSLKANSSSVRFDGITIAKAYKRPELLTYLPQFNFIPASLSLKRIFNDFEISYPDFVAFFPEFKDSENMKIKKLSGGQRRLVEVYVIIKSNAQFVMLDEPFSHVMPLHIEKLKALLHTEKQHKGFLITDHMYRQIIDASDQLYLLTEGKIHLTSTTEDIERLGYARF
ncbi:ATP-binding cassette domain-containing protein [Pedobacter sp. Hv1]|uniref:ATP-binding cassette domain-containing protein n=1 Tax=Pedobacter sp. Hv1 TaxID=1740090 RepID=UPI0006D8A163|nr:ATP-binding cassette domain-containing protein [Pedobacter sp. Hv1]KQC00291.1 hypothetical protein AQF98_12425 [Pedobacter sp. Hv1]